MNFDVTARELGVAHRGWSRHDLALDAEHRFRTDRLRACHHLGGSPARPHRDLHEPGAVAQIEEDDPSEVAAPVDPAAQFHLLPDVLLAKLAAAMGSLGCPSHAFASVYAPPISASHRMR